MHAAMNTGAAIAESLPRSPMDCASDALARALDVAHARFEHIASRIDPVLNPASPDQAKGGLCGMSSAAPMVQQLDSYASAIERLNARMEDVLNRLAL